MIEIQKETVTTQPAPSVQPAGKTDTREVSGSKTTEYVLYFVLGLLEILLAFRLVLRMTGASQASDFVRVIYGMTSIFIMPFEGIFRRGVTQGIETTAVFEPSTLVAMIVFALIAWGIVKLIRILSGEKQPD